MKKLIIFIFLLAIGGAAVPITGAAGNDLDTREEIQTAINKVSQNGGGTVNLPAEKIVLDEPLKLKSNVHLKGAGVDRTVLTIVPIKNGAENPERIIMADNQDNIEITNMTIDGDKHNRKSFINTGDSHSVSLAYVDTFTVWNVKFIDSVGAGLALWNASNGRIENNKFINSGTNALLGMQETHHIRVINNVIDKTDNQNGIFFMYQGESSHDITINGNTINDAADYGIEVGHTTQKEGDLPHRNIFIMNNKITNSYCTGIGLRSVSDAVVEKNTITGYAEISSYGCNGIFVEGRADLQKNVTVGHNTITQTNPKHIDDHLYQQAIYVTGIENSNIKGNIIDKSWENAISVNAA